MHIALCVRIITVYIVFSWVSKCKISSTNANTFIFIVMDSLILKVSFNESSSSPPIALAAWRLVHWHGMLGRSKNPGKELATPPKTQSEKHAQCFCLVSCAILPNHEVPHQPAMRTFYSRRFQKRLVRRTHLRESGASPKQMDVCPNLCQHYSVPFHVTC